MMQGKSKTSFYISNALYTILPSSPSSSSTFHFSDSSISPISRSIYLKILSCKGAIFSCHCCIPLYETRSISSLINCHLAMHSASLMLTNGSHLKVRLLSGPISQNSQSLHCIIIAPEKIKIPENRYLQKIGIHYILSA